MRTVSRSAARRIALASHGFTDARPTGRVDVRHFRRVMRRVGLVQLDSVNVCVRTHYMPFYSRLGPYDRDRLDAWLNASGEHFEYWAHEASVLPVERYPLWRWRMDAHVPGRRALALMEEHPGVVESVHAQVRADGPLTVTDLDAPNHRNEPWWGYGPGKIALEHLFAGGQITALRTGTFMRSYDVPERIIPAAVLAAEHPSQVEAHRTLLRDAVTHVGIGTVHDIADYHRLHIPTARPMLAEMARRGDIAEVEVPGWKGPVYLDPEATRPRRITGAALISPFDPLIWYRPRVERLFDFAYRIEIYVPAPRRVYGYYVLPFLLDGELVARVDLKADRARSTLMVRSAFIEDGADPTRVSGALAAELRRFASWLALDDVGVASRGNLATELRRRS